MISRALEECNAKPVDCFSSTWCLHYPQCNSDTGRDITGDVLLFDHTQFPLEQQKVLYYF